jgi:hypothetical protein
MSDTDKPAPPQPSWDCDAEGRKRVARCDASRCRWWSEGNLFPGDCNYPCSEDWPEICGECGVCYPGQMLGPEGE